MEPQTIIDIIAGAVLAALGWFANEMWTAMKELRQDVHDLEVTLPSRYVRREEFSEGIKEIKDLLGKIFDKLDNKVDK
jgi:hypothetical protein